MSKEYIWLLYGTLGFQHCTDIELAEDILLCWIWSTFNPNKRVPIFNHLLWYVVLGWDMDGFCKEINFLSIFVVAMYLFFHVSFCIFLFLNMNARIVSYIHDNEKKKLSWCFFILVFYLWCAKWFSFSTNSISIN